MTGISGAGFPILTVITFLPALGALFLIIVVRKEWTAAVKWTARGVSAAEFLVSLSLPITFDPANPGYQWVEKYQWIGRYGISYYLGADGISMLLVLLTTFITVICVLASWRDIKSKIKGYMILFL
ncbi:MAG: hypothetical protein HZB21_04750, partial [Deltaproteobacteria bacterium]|nr:hypothetical protein [Deltaproteobacteria bacterium]